MSLISGQGPRSFKSGATSQASGMSRGQNYADKKAMALAAKNTSVLSYDELERIKMMCSQTSEA
jgi:hypothetical protein